MTDVDVYLRLIDEFRLRRCKELSELKVRMMEVEGVARYGIHSKALIVLAYAHWEGFYNECANCFIDALRAFDRKVADVSWLMLVGVLRPELQKLQDRNHSSKAESDFVSFLKHSIENDFSEFDRSVISARSNLDFAKLEQCFSLLGFDITPFQRLRIRIDKELVGWRHGVAHGSEPDLSSVDINRHIGFTQQILLLVADVFQDALVKQYEK